MKIFIASTGRSGTFAISKAFNFKQEPYEWAYKNKFSIDLLKQRAIEQEKQNGYYGEIGHHIIQHIPKIQKEFPNAIYIHSVRNPRKVVKSFWELNFGEEKTYGKDFNGDKLEKICQMWTYWNKEADKLIPIRIRFEDYCQALRVSNAKKKRKERKEWTDKEENILQKYCGDLMKKYGYE